MCWRYKSDPWRPHLDYIIYSALANKNNNLMARHEEQGSLLKESVNKSNVKPYSKQRTGADWVKKVTEVLMSKEGQFDGMRSLCL